MNPCECVMTIHGPVRLGHDTHDGFVFVFSLVGAKRTTTTSFVPFRSPTNFGLG
jgi:hypothetical protein